MIDCANFNLNFSLIDKQSSFAQGYFTTVVGLSWKYKLLDNVSLRKVKIDFLSCEGMFCFPGAPFRQISLRIFKTTQSTSTILFDSTSQQGLRIDGLTLVIELEEPLTFYKDDEILIDVGSLQLTPAWDPVFEGEIL
jgi:hypothetical protein